MLWNKKEDKSSLPDLPDISYKSDKNMLPSFPDSMDKRGFSQSAIKEAVSEAAYSEENELPELPEADENSSKLPEWQPSITHSSSKEPSELEDFPEEEKMKSEEVPERRMFAELSSPRTKNSDIFVKIDKFHTAKKTLYSIKSKVEEIESLLKRIRETKLKEERELSFWENELMNVKVKIKDVNENIFEKA